MWLLMKLMVFYYVDSCVFFPHELLYPVLAHFPVGCEYSLFYFQPQSFAIHVGLVSRESLVKISSSF